VPVADLVRPIVKKVYEITDVNDVASTVLEALYVCTSGRPGPVLIDFPKNIQQQRVRTWNGTDKSRLCYCPIRFVRVKRVLLDSSL